MKSLREWVEEMIEKVKGSQRAFVIKKDYAAGYLTGLRQVLHEIKFREDAGEEDSAPEMKEPPERFTEGRIKLGGIKPRPNAPKPKVTVKPQVSRPAPERE